MNPLEIFCCQGTLVTERSPDGFNQSGAILLVELTDVGLSRGHPQSLLHPDVGVIPVREHPTLLLQGVQGVVGRHPHLLRATVRWNAHRTPVTVCNVRTLTPGRLPLGAAVEQAVDAVTELHRCPTVGAVKLCLNEAGTIARSLGLVRSVFVPKVVGETYLHLPTVGAGCSLLAFQNDTSSPLLRVKRWF